MEQRFCIWVLGVTIPSSMQECYALFPCRQCFPFSCSRIHQAEVRSAGRGGDCDLALAVDLLVNSKADNLQMQGTAEMLPAPAELC